MPMDTCPRRHFFGLIISRKFEPGVIELNKDPYILVVDDEEYIRNLIARILKSRGHQVLLAENGTRAMEIYKEHVGEIHMVTLDIRMPDISGIDVYRKMAAINPLIRVLLCSAYCEKIPDGANPSAIEKPFSVTGFYQKVKEVLNLSDNEIRLRNGPFLFLEI